MKRYELAVPEDAEDRAAYHRIRRTVLFEARGRFDYVADDLEELKPGNLSLLFKHNDEAIGTVRLDRRLDGKATIRLVAIAIPFQRQGHGTALMRCLEGLAISLGVVELSVHAAPDAVAFYRRLGFSEVAHTGSDSRSVLMWKRT